MTKAERMAEISECSKCRSTEINVWNVGRNYVDTECRNCGAEVRDVFVGPVITDE